MMEGKKEQAMREYPIIMGAKSVRDIFAGLKGETRRVVNPQPYTLYQFNGTQCPRNPSKFTINGKAKEIPDGLVKCPYGKVGDRLWVKETWGVVSHTFDENENICAWVPDRPCTPITEMKFGNGYYDGHVIYKSDGDFEWNAGDDCSIETKSAWNPAMYMPRLASRLTLEITGIIVEKLQDITEEDAIAEGVISNDEYDKRAGEYNLFPCPRCDGYRLHEGFGHDYGTTEVDCTYCDTAIKRYRIIWDSLNAKRGFPWSANPWVWVIEFEKVEEK